MYGSESWTMRKEDMKESGGIRNVNMEKIEENQLDTHNNKEAKEVDRK